MMSIETKFNGIPAHKGQFVRTSFEIQMKTDGKKVKTRKVTIIDVHTPLSKSSVEK